ncbi:MAG TPA: hypothetical protein VMS77_07665 [Conexivisphaerales archaeon]|nr:hypothetical protein [Conexivisphaerales archaeon]
MTSERRGLADEAAELATQVAGAGARFEDACRRVAARDLRGSRRREAEAFFDGVRKVVDTAKASPEWSRERQQKETLVFLVKARDSEGALRVEARVETVEPKRMKDLIESREAYALPEGMFWDFSEWFKDGIFNGSFDLKGTPGTRVSEMIYSEFRGASRSWLERKNWNNLLEALEGVS